MPDLFDLEIEQGILGSIMFKNATWYDAAAVIGRKHFYDPLHGYLFEMFGTRLKLGRAIDAKIIRQFVDDYEDIPEFDPGEYLQRLSTFAMPTLITDYCLTVRDLAIRRDLSALAVDAKATAETPAPDLPIEKVIDGIELSLQDLRGNHKTRFENNSWRGALQQSIDRAGHAYQHPEDIGWPWFIDEMEDAVGEKLQGGMLIGLLADSGGGKTSLAVQQLAYSAEMGIPSIMFSFEQTQAQVADQILSQRLDLQSRLWRRGQVTEGDFDRVVEYSQSIQRWPLEVHKMFNAKVSDIALRARRFFRNHGPGLVVIDHAKRIKPDDSRQNLADQINQLYGDAKNMALEHEAAVLLLMQRNSEGTRRTNPRPMRGDVYGGGGAIENLDYCVAIWRKILWLRDQLPNLQSDEAIGKNLHEQGEWEFKAELIGLKARYAEAGVSRTVSYTPQFTRCAAIAAPEPDLLGGM